MKYQPILTRLISMNIQKKIETLLPFLVLADNIPFMFNVKKNGI